MLFEHFGHVVVMHQQLVFGKGDLVGLGDAAARREAGRPIGRKGPAKVQQRRLGVGMIGQFADR